MQKIIFYKLQSPYSEDETKDCKLSLTELDSNFLAFKDNDISGATFDEDSKTLYIKRNNGELIGVDLSSLSDEIEPTSGITSIPELTISGSYDQGTLQINVGYSGDTESVKSITISGITGTSPIVIHDVESITHDESFIGGGNEESPLRLGPTAKTGLHQICKKIVAEYLENPKFGDRFILIENTTNTGYLYNKEGIEEINELLANKETNWHIPSKEEWDDLLNYLEDYDEQKNHNTEEDGVYGGMAAYKLKGCEHWSYSEDMYGFNIIPYSIEGNVLKAGFWSSTNNKVKLFNDEEQTVEQKTASDNDYYSIRLVCDELLDDTLFGQKYDIVYMPELNQYWLASNLNVNLNNDNSINPASEFSAIIPQHSIIEWYGDKWQKGQLQVGDEVTAYDDYDIVKYILTSSGLVQLSRTTILDSGNTKTTIDAGWY